MTESLVGIRECARELGVNASTVSRQVRAGIIPNRGTKDAPLVLVSEARGARRRNLDQSKQRGPGAPLFAPADQEGDSTADVQSEAEDEPRAHGEGKRSGLDFNKARTAREGYQARLAQIELEDRLGNLLDRAETVDAFFTLGTALREALERRAPELAARLDGVADLNARTGLILEDDRRLLQAIVDNFTRRFVSADAAAA